LRLVAEPNREHGQHRPTKSESEQESTCRRALLRRNEWGGNKQQTDNESADQRPGHDPTYPSSRPAIRAGWESRVLEGGFRGCGGHDALDPAKTLAFIVDVADFVVVMSLSALSLIGGMGMVC
jgi:hypothetical protein